jgi:hypothetical protein
MYSHNGGENFSVSVLATPTLIKNFDVEPRNSLVIANVSSGTVYIGYNVNLTTANGFPLVSGERMSEEYFHGAVYGIVTTGTAELRVRSY